MFHICFIHIWHTQVKTLAVLVVAPWSNSVVTLILVPCETFTQSPWDPLHAGWPWQGGRVWDVGFQELTSVVVDVKNKSPAWRLLLSSLHTCSFWSANTFDYVKCNLFKNNNYLLRIVLHIICMLPDPNYSTIYIPCPSSEKAKNNNFCVCFFTSWGWTITGQQTHMHAKRTTTNQPMSQHFWPVPWNQICCHWMEKFPQHFLVLYGLDFFLCRSPDQRCFLWQKHFTWIPRLILLHTFVKSASTESVWCCTA